MTTAPVPTPAAQPRTVRMRTSNAERQRVAALIESSIAQGTWTPPEGEERLQAVHAAVYRDELDSAIADLPLDDWKAHRSGGSRATGSVRAALTGLFSAIAYFVGRHRTWT